MKFKFSKKLLFTLLLIAAAFCLPLIMKSDYQIMVTNIGCLVGLAVLGMVVLVGYTGQLSLGNVAFYAIGAYTSAICTTKFGLNPWVGVLIAIIFTALCGFIVGFPSFNLRGPFLVIITIGFSEIINILSVNLVELTGGPFGINSIPALSLFGIKLNKTVPFYYFILIITIVLIFSVHRIRYSRIGRSMVSVMDDEDAAEILGVNVRRTKLLSFTISAALAGFAGALYSSYAGYIVADIFAASESSLYFVITVLGGYQALPSVIVAIIVQVLPEFLRFLQNYYMLIFSIILLALVMFTAWRQYKSENGK